MDEFFVYLLIGHVFGDYVFQPLTLALNKKDDYVLALFHPVIYGFFVWVCTQFFFEQSLFKTIWMMIIIATHLAVDYTGVVNWWLNLIKGRSYENATAYIKEHKTAPELCYYMVAYTSIVQTVIDNSIHIFSLYLIYKLFILYG